MTRLPARASAAAASIKSVDLPMPGSPPKRSTEPRTKPPPVTRSNSLIPDGVRGASSPSPASGSSLKARPLRLPGCGAGEGSLAPPRFRGDGFPSAAGFALALPARIDRAAGLADEGCVRFGHEAQEIGSREPNASTIGRRLMHARLLQELAALAGFHRHVEGVAVAMDGERHADTGGAERPDLAVEIREIAHLVAAHGENDVAGLQFRAARGAPLGETRHHDALVDLGGVDPEPRPRRAVEAAELHEVVQHRLQNVDRHHPVDRLRTGPRARAPR